MENKRLIGVILIVGALAVAIGAFGAHGLKSYMSETGMANFQTANRYHFYHIILAFVISIHSSAPWARLASYLCLAGIVLFSGSLYTMALNQTFTYPAWLPILTPLGGICFIAGWLVSAYYFLKNQKN